VATIELFGLGAGVHHRANHAHGPSIKGFHDVRRIEPWHPHQWRDGGGGEGLEHGDHIGIVDQPVLHVDREAIVAQTAHHFSGEGVGD